MKNKGKFNNLNRDDWYQIAKMIDNNYIGSKDSFTYENICDGMYMYYLTTNRCDNASCIKVYPNQIFRLGDDTNGWEEIQEQTYMNIDNYIKEIK